MVAVRLRVHRSSDEHATLVQQRIYFRGQYLLSNLSPGPATNAHAPVRSLPNCTETVQNSLSEGVGFGSPYLISSLRIAVLARLSYTRFGLIKKRFRQNTGEPRRRLNRTVQFRSGTCETGAPAKTLNRLCTLDWPNCLSAQTARRT